MKILLLGYGKEGQAVEKYIKSHPENFLSATEKSENPTKKPEIIIEEDFDPDELKQRNYSSYDIIFRSPSVPPMHLKKETSATRFFFDHCPCPIIGVTATKGKGTTCSFIKSLLDAEFEEDTNRKAFLVGNIGVPAIEVLDELTENDVVVYEMSSFQLWDLQKSPHIAVFGMIEPDHLNVHESFDDYVDAKANITNHQTKNDYLIYYQKGYEAQMIARTSKAKTIPYPFDLGADVEAAISLPGEHNVQNATAAVAAVASLKNISPDEYLREKKATIIKGLQNFKGLPHRLEFLGEKNGIRYYDDNFSTNIGSTRVALKAFRSDNLFVIIGGRDKTDNDDLPEIFNALKSANIKRVILMGESGHELAKLYNDHRFRLVESLEEAVNTATSEAKDFKSPVVLMSPAAASFDMFKNVYDRGDQYQLLVKNL